MFRRSTLSSTLLCSLALLLAPLASQAESGFAPPGGNASASLDFRIIIPPIMRVLENSHPTELQADANGTLSGQQRLVVLSNMKRGFCVTLRRVETQNAAGWNLLNAGEPSGVTLTPVADGYRLCTARPGRYTLLLQHEFISTEVPGRTIAMAWPVSTDLMSL
jgi:hypothetical protein